MQVVRLLAPQFPNLIMIENGSFHCLNLLMMQNRSFQHPKIALEMLSPESSPLRLLSIHKRDEVKVCILVPAQISQALPDVQPRTPSILVPAIDSTNPFNIPTRNLDSAVTAPISQASPDV
jgi:uncharacterized Zn-finger protein